MKTNLFLIFLSLFLFIGCSSEEKFEEKQPDPEIPGVSTEYQPSDGGSIENDIAVKVSSANASEHQPGTEIEKSIDGDFSTNYHSRWNSTAYPVELEYHFTEDAEQIDYVVLRPRQNGPNGIILEADILIKSQGDEEYSKFGSYEFEDGNTPRMLTFPDGFKNPSSFKVSVKKGANDFVSLAEIEFFQKNESLTEDLSFFTNKAATEIVPGVYREELADIKNEFIRNMALSIFDGSYDPMRIGTFISYPNPVKAAASNKTSTYGLYDNVTGMYFSRNTEMVVFMSDFEGEISLRIVDHNQGFDGVDYMLRPGLNRFHTGTQAGLGYLIYHNDQEKEVTANFATGTVSGYYDSSKHTQADWNELISNAEYPFFDVLGEYAHLTFTTSAFRQYTTNIEELIGLYDQIVDLEQEFIGLYKYDRANKNRMYFRANTHQDMYMFATSYRTEYHENTLADIANPQTLRRSPWGPAHEVGHVNQTRPGLRWLGLTEVTTNIYSLYVQKAFGNGARIDVEDLGRYNNRYEKGFTELLAAGADHPSYDDVFVKLIPFWQLELYLSDVLGKKDFYKDLHEHIRISEDQSTHGHSQVEFVKIASDVAGLDLTEFFEAWGFLTPIDLQLDDYGNGQMLVTKQMVEEVKSYVAAQSYPKPDVIMKYITDSNINSYASRATVVPGTAVVSGQNLSINGSQNAVVFEQARDAKVIFISPKSSFKLDSFQPGDRIYAVGFDGDRQEVQLQ